MCYTLNANHAFKFYFFSVVFENGPKSEASHMAELKQKYKESIDELNTPFELLQRWRLMSKHLKTKPNLT